MGEREKVGRVDGRDVTVWNTAAAGRPSIDRVRASVDDAHAALRAYAERDNAEEEADRG